MSSSQPKTETIRAPVYWQMSCIRPLADDPFGTVRRRRCDQKGGEAEQENGVEQQGQVINVSSEAVPLATNKRHAQRMTEKVLSIRWSDILALCENITKA